jgi:hypothetical protein
MVSIEIMLSPGINKPVTKSIAESIAIISHNSKRYDDAIDEFKELYAKRSQIIHGTPKSVEKKDLINLRYITKHLIIWMIMNKDQFNSKEDMLRFLKDQIYRYKINS